VLQFLQALGIGVAVFVLLLTQAQIKDTRNALRASTELQIQKEGRDIWGSASEPAKPYVYAFDPNMSYKENVTREARSLMIRLLNFYASASRQHDHDTPDNEAWDSLNREFCMYLKLQPVRALWAEAINERIYDVHFMEIGNRCLATQNPR